ncbi:MAG: type II secretion system minor pseudopilin GspH [Parvularculaceae bacterium]
MDGRQIKSGLRARTHRQRGLTLLELLVVVVILALVTSIAVFNAPAVRSNARVEAERFAARTNAAFEDAVLEGSVMSIEMTPAGYKVLRYGDGKWNAVETRGRATEREYPKNVRVTLTVEDAALKNKSKMERPSEKDEPQRIIIDPIGLTAPFTVEFADGRDTWSVIGGAGKVKVEHDAQTRK